MTYPDAWVVLVPLKDNVRVGHELGNVASRRVLGVGHGAIPASAEVFQSLASAAFAHDTVVIAQEIKNLTLFRAASIRVGLRRTHACAAGNVPEYSADVATGSLGDDLNVVAYV